MRPDALALIYLDWIDLFGDATRPRGRASVRRSRTKRSERGPSFAERGRGAAKRSAEQSARNIS